MVSPVAVPLAMALLIRIGALASVPHAVGMDGANFARTAQNLADGYGYVGIRGSVNAVHVSLYPLLIVPAVWFGVAAERAAIAVSLTAGTLLVLPVYAIARRLFDARAAFVAAAIVALHPFAVATSIAALPDALAMTLGFAGLALFLRSADDPRVAWPAGALFGVAMATRSDEIGYAGIGALALLAGALFAPRARRTALRRLCALCAAFAVIAVPYTVAVSRATGGLRLDAKGPVNYAIGTRMLSGMSYDEAADGLAPGGREIGAELGPGFYQTHARSAGPTLRARVAFAARVAPRQLLRLGRLLASGGFGTPLFMLAALIGYAAALRRRDTRADALVLVAIIAVDVAALCTLAWIWDRLATIFVPLLAVGAAQPVALLTERAGLRMHARAGRVAAACGAVAIACTGLFTLHRTADAAGSALDRIAGAWLQTYAPGPKLVMAVGDEIAYYAGADWQPLPAATSSATLAYLHAKHPTFVVLEASRSGARAYLAGWLARGIPDRGARRVRAFGAGTPGVVVVYAWSGSRPSATSPREASAGIDVLTAHNGPQRLGWNPRERMLTTANVNPRAFGKLFEIPVDGQAYAQPLVVTGVDVPGLGRHDVLIAATERDSVYAFDARDGRRLWKRSFASCCGIEPATPSAIDANDPCGSVRPAIGISSTPVIDRRTGTIYVIAKTMTGGAQDRTFHNTLHALALDTGRDRLPPVEIAARQRSSLRGLFDEPMPLKHRLRRIIAGALRFDPRSEYNRTGLLLANGNVYAGFSSHCDIETAHGWVFAYRAADLHRVAAFPTTRDWDASWGGGVWQSGMGITADPDGNVYFTTGNGPFDAQRGGRDFSNSLLEMSPSLDRVEDYFTPFTQAALNDSDADFGGGAMLALPDTRGVHPHLGVVSSKVRALYLVDRDRLGRYVEDGPDRVLDRIGDEHDETHWCIGTCGAPAYYRADDAEYVYDVWALDALRAYRIDRARGRLVEIDHSRERFPGSGGAIPSISSNGERPGTAIVWLTTRPTISDAAYRPIELVAYDARNLSRRLYHGALSLWPNTVGHPFLTPTIAGGRVYVGGDHSIAVFGLRAR